MKHKSFRTLGLAPALLQALEAMGYRTPTPIQARSIPPLLAGKDLLGIAQTGTGKTAAFALPLLHALAAQGLEALSRQPRALILAPTRELAGQVMAEVADLARFLPLSCGVVYGGVGQQPQIDALRGGLDVLVATPGRLLDLIGQGHADLAQVQMLVLDEADRLLDMGFLPDVQQLVRRTPRGRQSLLFSATMPKAVASLAAHMLRRPVRVEASPGRMTVKDIQQRVIEVKPDEKRWVLDHLLREPAVTRALVFTRTRRGADQVTRQLLADGIDARAIHGDLSQRARERALADFRDLQCWVLVATDVAARGIDVQGISHVINYDLPADAESYVHRIGRTGRAGAGGAAWTLYSPTEVKHLRSIEALVGRIPSEAEAALGEQPARAGGNERRKRSRKNKRPS
ncbi:MAG: DEAD/DEAH box helicase [Gammaproteobacteria bacterium]|nr:DEAD/DEAH box helicase [Gammaproteobacteria bacterium]